MANWVQIDRCPIPGCGSPIFAEIVNSDRLPRIRVSCRCRQIYPERFRVAGQHGYRPGRNRS